MKKPSPCRGLGKTASLWLNWTREKIDHQSKSYAVELASTACYVPARLHNATSTLPNVGRGISRLALWGPQILSVVDLAAETSMTCSSLVLPPWRGVRAFDAH
ncbi:hypothetical protein [Gluconobacter kondonii]|uniref:hypothetical protein n=1 Tax=Gluconobacter kondonii TaxID=941463 RepID=UPI001B8C59C9|nr:hypothetical protein [Gluconobacter kondonii]MBS1056650.1 hypothetical protein [Gluconobacter kondonii]